MGIIVKGRHYTRATKLARVFHEARRDSPRGAGVKITGLEISASKLKKTI
ncbi:MAG: hypothetical protein P9F19_04065 [Candidatus Contendobacter sp.]|nr:hypothetical protein [Candidatus Contendobacter sp.]MDG4556560.1 hypothetical protein [Candidatus Contendobacter sp.]